MWLLQQSFQEVEPLEDPYALSHWLVLANLGLVQFQVDSERFATLQTLFSIVHRQTLK